MSNITNISLYIKRAEPFHTKEFITEAFSSNNIGKVRDVTFIKKVGDYGKDYNGVIVTFDQWCMNSKVKKLIDDMNSSIDGTTKFTFDLNKQRYWIINILKPKFENIEETEISELQNINLNISEKERILELENLVKSMSAQIHYMQLRQEKTEKLLMEHEHNETQYWVNNFELRSQLEEKDIEFKYYENKFQEENDALRCRVACLAMEHIKKDREIEEIRQQLYDESNVLAFVEEQANEMRNMIKQTGKSKPCVTKELLD